jgi:hypothetical protein
VRGCEVAECSVMFRVKMKVELLIFMQKQMDLISDSKQNAYTTPDLSELLQCFGVKK